MSIIYVQNIKCLMIRIEYNNAITETEAEIIPSLLDLIQPLRPRVTRKKKKLRMKMNDRVL